jgi:5-methylthioadenosine/S-adenosylhomocysteine deaminase
MRHCDSLIASRWCIPIEPAGAVLEDHAVAIVDGRIAAILPADEAREAFQPSVFVERKGHVLIPGLINAHVHAAMTLFRGLADNLALDAWLREGIWPVERRFASAELVRDGTELAIAEMLAAGITCFSDQYFFPEIVAETAVDLHMRAMIGTPVVDIPTAWADDVNDYLNKGSDLVHDRFADHPLLSTCFAPLHESQSEVMASVESTGKRPIERLDELGLLNASLLAVHAVHVTPAEIDRLASAGVGVAHCPTSNLKLACGIAPVRALSDAGVTVGVGTDGAASNNMLDILAELRMAALVAKVADDGASINAEQVLRMATIDAAKTLRRDHEIGTLESGKWADLTCIDLMRCNSQPVYDPISQLVYATRADQVSDVWVAGRHLLDQGELTTINRESIFKRSGEWQRRIADFRK